MVARTTTSITVTWRAPLAARNDNLTNYYLEIRNSQTKVFAGSGFKGFGMKLIHTFHGLEPGTRYIVSIFAYNSAGNGTAVEKEFITKATARKYDA